MSRHLSEQSVERELGLGAYRDDQLERRVAPGGRFVGLIFTSAEAVVAGDDAAGWFLVIPEDLGGQTLVHAHAAVYTPGADVVVQVRNVTQAADMLSTPITIDSGDNTSYTSGAQPVIVDAEVARGDLLVVDVDDDGGAEGLDIILAFE